ncbi:site-specific integrase [Lactococcus formosensis]|uniref:site-specific integrase n=1 Tax=Lactococcus formosensis TaxID=1281486 RepID=UPI001F05864C|nr:site-specific integrase [Lactococcus formosensis]MCH1723331.1 site-specific integrase [Lactococcus formosensis]
MYKVGAVSEVTLAKYRIASKFLRQVCPKLFLSDFDRMEFQKILNEYAKNHERQTTADFHTQVKACIRDLFHDRQLEIDPTYRAVIKGKAPSDKKKKFLQVEELQKLMHALDLNNEIGIDWMVFIIAKTGIRFAEALAITPEDFDWTENKLSIDKTWDYKSGRGGFKPTKTKGSVRKITLDWQTIGLVKPMLQDLPPHEPIFIEKLENGSYKKYFNSTLNNFMSRKCKEAGITEISCHGLRHTHASVLLSAGVSIHSISARLGHADVGVTQETYAHVLDELQKKDDQKMIATLMQIA